MTKYKYRSNIQPNSVEFLQISSIPVAWYMQRTTRVSLMSSHLPSSQPCASVQPYISFIPVRVFAMPTPAETNAPGDPSLSAQTSAPESTALDRVHLPRITIKFCTQCRWMLRAAYVSRAPCLPIYAQRLDVLDKIPAGNIRSIHKCTLEV